MDTEYKNTFEAWAEVFTIFAKYQKGKPANVTVEYDTIWSGPDNDIEVTDDDKKRLKELGWDYESDMGFWLNV